MSIYTFRFENLETETVWVSKLTAGPWSDGEDVANHLEDTDAVEELTEIVDSLIGIEPEISWNEAVFKMSFDEAEDSDCLDVISHVRKYFKGLDARLSLPEEDEVT